MLRLTVLIAIHLSLQNALTKLSLSQEVRHVFPAFFSSSILLFVFNKMNFIVPGKFCKQPPGLNV